MMEVVGYTFRILSSRQDPYRVAWFVIQVSSSGKTQESLSTDIDTSQYFFIVVAPVFFSAAIYSIASILAIVYGKQYSPLPPKFILWIFIVCDIVATITQVAGAALVGVAYSNQRDPKTYNHILLAGLAFQVFSFAVFLCVLFTTLQKSKQSRETINRGFLVALVVATVMVYLRTCFRLAETAEGLMAYLSTHEVFFGCLEFLPIVVAVYLLTYWHPGRWLDKTPTGKDRRRIAIEGAERQ